MYWTEKLDSPGSLLWAGDWPHQAEPLEISELVQGIAHNATHHFFSKRYGVFRVPIGENLSDEHRRLWDRKAGIPERLAGGRDHFGDIDQYKGYVFAPLEKYGWTSGDPTARLIIFNLQLEVVGHLDFPPSLQRSAGWVAINPLNGYLYSNDGGDIHVYDWRNSTNGQLAHLYSISKPDEVYLGQGAAFSASGKLYTARQRHDSSLYIYGMLISGRAAVVQTVRHEGGVFPTTEGVDVWDSGRDVESVHPKFSGQIHVICLDADIGTDQWYIYHYKVADVSRL
ncbi:hypothetical protein PV371_37450 [Streptomyces sp. TX20-6-3]|uniref:hypothetical protein n=1 Tax=Streptomyces sp. TX20-6-3 TaxID=3028705 RepID=UPI0029B6488C|nr:hypothetical protein [Streptomyces sp. TX20-6-3]MDX2565281.1 hypothetical protein [Streptomyces sp. TX20-6-3]